MSLRIAQIGMWPPPWGGMSVYLQRLSHGLVERGHDVLVLSPTGHHLDPAPNLRVRHSPDQRSAPLRRADAMLAAGVQVAHMHLMGLPWKAVVPQLTACQAAGIPLVVSSHSFRDYRPDTPLWHRSLMQAAGAGVAHALASGGHVAERMRASGMRRVTELPPFVPPPPLDRSRLPAGLAGFFERHGPVLSAGAGALRTHPEGGDLYGFDLFVEVALEVARVHPDAGFVFQLPRIGEQPLFDAAMARAAPLGDRLLVHREPLIEASDLWAASDLFLRPTLSDGDSISIREALHLGVPTLTSDAVARPEGARCYPSRDAAAAGRIALDMLARLDEERRAVAALPTVDTVPRVEAVLREAAATPIRVVRPAARLLRPAAAGLARRLLA